MKLKTELKIVTTIMKIRNHITDNYLLYILLVISFDVFITGYINPFVLILMIPAVTSLFYYSKWNRRIDRLNDIIMEASDNVEEIKTSKDNIVKELKEIQEIKLYLLKLGVIVPDDD